MTIVSTNNLAIVTLSPSGYTPNLYKAKYTLNGEDVEVDIIGSPGLQRKETKTIVLTGFNSKLLTWERSHTEFEVEVRLSTTDDSQTPIVDSIEVKEALNAGATPTTSSISSIQSSETGTLQEEAGTSNTTASTIQSSETGTVKEQGTRTEKTLLSASTIKSSTLQEQSSTTSSTATTITSSETVSP